MKNIDLIVEKYLAAETSLEEEAALREYFLSDNVAEDHAELIPMFMLFDERSSMKSNVDVTAILTATSKENTLSVNRAEATEYTGNKNFSIKRYIPAIAATMVALMAVVVLFNRPGDTPFKESENVVVLNSESEQEEAIKVTRQALALLSKNYNKGAQAVQEMKHIEKTQIFK